MMIGLLFLLAAQAAAPSVSPADIERARARAQPVLDRYYDAVKRCGARPPFKPRILANAGDGIIRYDPPAGQVMLFTWPASGGEIRAAAAAQAAALTISERESYERTFNETLVAHELGHWLQGFQPEPRTAAGVYDGWYAEQNANRLMVAFWREHPGAGVSSADRFRGDRGAQAPNPLPPPEGVSIEDFFTGNTMKIVRAGAYGWYQGEMMRRALAERPAPRFCVLVGEWLPLRD